MARADRSPRDVAIPGRLSRLSVCGNLCPLEDHLRTTPRHRLAIAPMWRGMAWHSIAWRGSAAPIVSRVSRIHTLCQSYWRTPRAFRRRILPFTYSPPAPLSLYLSQPDRNDYETARPPPRRSLILAFIPSRIDSWHCTQIYGSGPSGPSGLSFPLKSQWLRERTT